MTEDEHVELVKRAAQAGMSQSAFLRAVGLNQPIRSIVDLQAIADLGKINGDLGRVAGLLKLLLSARPVRSGGPIDVEVLMVSFRRLQTQLCEQMGEILRAHK